MDQKGLTGSTEFGPVAFKAVVGDDVTVTANNTNDGHVASLRIFMMSFLEDSSGVFFKHGSVSQVGGQTLVPVNSRCKTTPRVSTLSLENNSI
jgi:hypothetical protein